MAPKKNVFARSSFSVSSTIEPEHHCLAECTMYTYYTPTWKIDSLSKPKPVYVPTDD
jgi:hypothetical protein